MRRRHRSRRREALPVRGRRHLTLTLAPTLTPNLKLALALTLTLTRCGDAVICRARANLLHTHAIVVHARALDWLLPMLSKVDLTLTLTLALTLTLTLPHNPNPNPNQVEEGRSTRIMPVGIQHARCGRPALAKPELGLLGRGGPELGAA